MIFQVTYRLRGVAGDAGRDRTYLTYASSRTDAIKRTREAFAHEVDVIDVRRANR